nr:MarR family transcriptional regulator [Pseudonocardia sp. AL041005-10]
MNRLALQLRDLIVATDEYRRAEAAALGIGVAEAAVLGEIHHRGPLPPSALVVRLGIASAGVTALLDRLTVAGLVQREPHPTDRRSVLVTLTPRGRAAITAMFAMFTGTGRRAARPRDLGLGGVRPPNGGGRSHEPPRRTHPRPEPGRVS